MPSKRKPQPDDFDVTEFLRPTDTDLKSALTSLLAPAPGDSPAFQGIAVIAATVETTDSELENRLGLEVLPSQIEDNIASGSESGPGSYYRSGVDLASDCKLESGLELASDSNIEPHFRIVKPTGSSQGSDINIDPGPIYDPDIKHAPGIYPDPAARYGPAAKFASSPIIGPGPRNALGSHTKSDSYAPPQGEGITQRSRFRIRPMKRAQDAHTATEQLLYEFLWKTATQDDGTSRMITIGLGGIMRALGLSKNGARAALRSLIKKLAIEERRTYRCEDHTAITYRILSYQEILRRRKEVGLIWYMKRTQAVVFVDPKTGLPMETNAYIFHPNPAPGSIYDPDTNNEAGSEQNPPPGVNYDSGPAAEHDLPPGSEYGPHYRELYKRTSFREPPPLRSSSSTDQPPLELTQQLRQLLPVIDSQAVETLWNECRSRVTDCTVEQIIHFSCLKTAVCRNGKIQNPIGFLLAAVPKCFEGQAFESFREDQRRLKEEQLKREGAEREQARLQEEEVRREEEAYRNAEEALGLLSKAEYEVLYDGVKKALSALVPNLASWKPEAREQSIRIRMIRELQKQQDLRA